MKHRYGVIWENASRVHVTGEHAADRKDNNAASIAMPWRRDDWDSVHRWVKGGGATLARDGAVVHSIAVGNEPEADACDVNRDDRTDRAGASHC